MRKLLTLGICTAFVAFAATPSFAADDALSRIKSSGTLRVCVAESAPMNSKDPKTNEWTGYFYSMAGSLAASLGVKLMPVDASWSTIVELLKAGKCDMSVAETFVTSARAQQVLFTDPISSNSQAAFVRVDDPMTSIDDLNQPSKTIAVISGAAEEKQAKKLFPKATVKVLVTDRHATPLLEVASHRADAAFTALAPTLQFMAKNSNVKLRKLNKDPLFPTEAAWMVPLGEYHFQQYVDIWLHQFESSDEAKALKAKWLADK
jgi:polar amino acid transport system substrate-binding protein